MNCIDHDICLSRPVGVAVAEPLLQIGRLRSPRGCDDADAIAEVLGDTSYLLGQQVSSVDVVAYACLKSTVTGPVESPLKAHVLGRPELVAFIERSDAHLVDLSAEA